MYSPCCRVRASSPASGSEQSRGPLAWSEHGECDRQNSASRGSLCAPRGALNQSPSARRTGHAAVEVDLTNASHRDGVQVVQVYTARTGPVERRGDEPALQLVGFTKVPVAVTGVAGPMGGTPDKPVGMVCLAWARREASVDSVTRYFDGDRQQIRQKTIDAALDRLLDYACSGTDGRS